MTRQLFIVAAGLMLGSGLLCSSSAMAAVSVRQETKKPVQVNGKAVRHFGQKKKLGSKRRLRDTTAVLVPEGPFQGRSTVGDIPDTVMR